MAKTKYDELKDAYEHNDGLFKEYENDCNKFIRGLRQEIVSCLGCSQREVEWLRFAEDESHDRLQTNNIVEITLDRSMALQSDAYYQFGLRILFDTKWIDLNFRVKRFDKCFLVMMGTEKRTIDRNKHEELDALVQHLFNLIKEYFEVRFTDFVQEKRSRLGFITS